MESLPSHLYYSILLNLDTKELLGNLALVCTEFRDTVLSDWFLQQVVKRDLYMQSKPSFGRTKAIPLIKELRTSKPQDLEFLGFSTDGGVDEDDFRFWVANLFERSPQGYCCHERKENVNCCAVLLETQNIEGTYLWAKKQAVSIIKEWLRKKGKTLRSNQETTALVMFQYVVNNFPIGAIAQDEENPQEFEDKVQRIINLLSEENPFKATRRNSQDNLVLDSQVELSRVSETTAVIKELDISRLGEYTCPVRNLIVFVSEEFIDVTDPCLKVYDNLKTEESLQKLSQEDNLVPELRTPIRAPGYLAYEFKKTKSPLKPLVWLSFSDENRATEVTIKLQQPVSGVFLYVKLINPENRMEQQGWVHEYMNIDCTHVIARGHLVKFEDI